MSGSNREAGLWRANARRAYLFPSAWPIRALLWPLSAQVRVFHKKLWF